MAIKVKSGEYARYLLTNCSICERIEQASREVATDIVLDWKFPQTNRELIQILANAFDRGAGYGVQLFDEWLEGTPDAAARKKVEELEAWNERMRAAIDNQPSPPAGGCGPGADPSVAANGLAEFTDLDGGARILVSPSNVAAVREFGEIGAELVTTGGSIYVTASADEAVLKLGGGK